MQTLLDEAGIELAGLTVLDICCNSGLMMALALHQGARWALGWDLPVVAQHAERILPILGANRFNVTKTKLGPDYALVDSLPEWTKPHLEGAVVFYLAAVQHIDLIEDLANVPWKALVYEGHSDDTDAFTKETYARIQSLWNAELASSTQLSDTSGTRPLAIFTRM